MSEATDVWSIIGLASLVAAVVTAILSTIKEVLVEKNRFKREKRAEYLKRQIDLYSQINFLLRRSKIAGGVGDFLLGSMSDSLKEINDIMKKCSSLLENSLLNTWLDYMDILNDATKAVKEQREHEYFPKITTHQNMMISEIKKILNDTLIPKYRKIVGDTVPKIE